MATLAEELERWKRKHPELADKGMVSVADPNAPGPRLGNVAQTPLEKAQIYKKFRAEGGKEAFLDKIGARYMEDVGGEGMTWQEKTGMQLYDPAAQKRFLFREELKKAGKSKYIKGILAHGRLAEIIGTDIAAERKAGVDIATGLMTAETARERTGVMEAERGETARHRAALESIQMGKLGVAEAGLESMDISRKATAGYQAGMLEVARETRPGSLESKVARLELQREKDIADVIQKEGAPEGETDEAKRKWYLPDAPNEAMQQIMAIDERYEKIIKGLRGMGKAVKGVKAPKGAKAPSFEDVQRAYADEGKTITREQWDAYLASEEGKKRYPGGK